MKSEKEEIIGLNLYKMGESSDYTKKILPQNEENEQELQTQSNSLVEIGQKSSKSSKLIFSLLSILLFSLN